MKRFNVFLHKELTDGLNQLSKKFGRTKSSLIREAIRDLLKKFGIMVVIILIGCGSSDQPSFYKVYDWQNRERLCQKPTPQCPKSGDMYVDILIVIDSYPVEYHLDGANDYFQTSEETIFLGTGDCEDIANLYMVVLSKSCLVERYGLDVRSRIIEMADGSRHAIVIIYTETEVFHIDNGIVFTVDPDEKVLVEYDLWHIF